MNTGNIFTGNQSNSHQNNNTIDESRVKEGLDFILNHFKGRIFPRTIMTKKLGYQKEIFDKESILREYQLSNYQDCRINAYSSFTNYKGINRTPPTFIMIDLDLRDVEYSQDKLEITLQITLKKIHNSIEGYPTVLWTGNGYHIYQPLEGFILEEHNIFTPFHDDKDLTSKFMKFAEGFFTGNKNDSNHNPSIKSCLVRIPNTINSKLSNEKDNTVKIVQEWDGYNPPINYLLREFRRYLIQEKINNFKISKISKLKTNNNHRTTWIEKLLQTPIEEGRKNCLWKILCPYLVNVKKLSFDETCIILKQWLDECDKKRRLDFNPNSLIKTDLKNVGNYYPIRFEKLKQENNELYQLINQNIY